MANDLDQARAFEQALTARLSVPAAECMQGPPGSAPPDQAWKELLANACSKKRDTEVERSRMIWRVAALAAAPPLRPLPAVAPTATPSDKRIYQARFARTAPIVSLDVEREHRIVDAITGQVIFQEVAGGRSGYGALSANGRLAIYSHGGDVYLRSVVTGSPLLELKTEYVYTAFWMDPDALLYRSSDGRGRVLDLRTGQDFEVLVDGFQSRSLPVPTKRQGQREYLILSSTSILQVQLAASEDDRNAPKIVRDWPLDRRSWTGWDGLSLDGRYFADGFPFMTVFDLQVFEKEGLSFAPFAMEGVFPALEPNEWIVTLYPFGRIAERKLYIFNAKEKTLAVVDAQAVPTLYFFVARPFGRLAVVTESGLRYLDRIPRGEALPFEVMAARAR